MAEWTIDPITFVTNNNDGTFVFDENDTTEERNYIITYTDNQGRTAKSTYQVPTGDCHTVTTCYDILIDGYNMNTIDLIISDRQDIESQSAPTTDTFSGAILRDTLGQKCVQNCNIIENGVTYTAKYSTPGNSITTWTTQTVTPNDTYYLFKVNKKTIGNNTYYDFIRLGKIKLTTQLNDTCRDEYLTVTLTERDVTINWKVSFDELEKAQIYAVLKYNGTQDTLFCQGTHGTSSSGVNTGTKTIRNTSQTIDEILQTCSWDLSNNDTYVDIEISSVSFKCKYDNGRDNFYHKTTEGECDRIGNIPVSIRCDTSSRCSDICVPYVATITPRGNDVILATISFGFTRE